MSANSGTLRTVNRCRQRLTQQGLRGLVRISARLRPERLLSLGRGLGWAAKWMLRRRLSTNLRCAGLEADAGLLDRYFQLLGNWAGWSLAVYQRGFADSGIAGRIHMDASIANLDRAVAKGRGVILTAGHYFCHEIAAAALNQRHPTVALVRESKDPARQALKQHWYEATGLEIVHRSRRASVFADTLAYLRELRRGKILAITPDLPVREGKGVAVSMFGRQVILPAGIIALAARAGAPVVCSWMEWLNDSHGRPTECLIRYDEPMEFPARGDAEAVQQAGMQEWCRRYEANLRKDLANWMFWLDKAWTRIWRAAA